MVIVFLNDIQTNLFGELFLGYLRYLFDTNLLMVEVNPLTAKLFNLNFQPLDVVSR